MHVDFPLFLKILALKKKKGLFIKTRNGRGIVIAKALACGNSVKQSPFLFITGLPPEPVFVFFTLKKTKQKKPLPTASFVGISNLLTTKAYNCSKSANSPAVQTCGQDFIPQVEILTHYAKGKLKKAWIASLRSQ